jgi:beta-glucuronidase
LGWTWYNREFYVNSVLQNSIANNELSIALRLASCHYFCIVWLNGIQLGTHESGHLPFEFDISSIVSEANRDETFNLVVAVNNTLSINTIPPADIFYGNDPNL